MATMLLHAFAHNPAAIHAHERLGFHTASLILVKALAC